MTVFDKALAAAARGQSLQTITLLAAPDEHKDRIGSMLFFQAEEIYGEIISPAFSRQAVDLVCRSGPGSPGILTAEGGYRFFCDCVRQPKRAVICGAGHISVPLTEFLSRLEYDVTVIDDRPEFANASRFPQARQVICNSFAAALASVPTDSHTAVIIVTRGHRYDADCLRILIQRPYAYLGMIGSRRRIAAIRQILADEGIGSEQLQSLCAPIGLDIGAKTPAEIALSIAAEIISVSRESTYLPLSQKEVRS